MKKRLMSIILLVAMIFNTDCVVMATETLGLETEQPFTGTFKGNGHSISLVKSTKVPITVTP